MDTLTLSKQADLISAHDYYLSTNVVADFCNYFADFLVGRVFNPPYVTRTLRPKCQYVFTSFEHAWSQYGVDLANQEMAERIRCYQTPLREAVAARDDEKTIALIQNVFSEKLIASNHQEWLTENQQGVAELLHVACEKLTEPSPEFDAFGREGGPRMTASLSKIYALLIGDFLSYESRVAAGLCYMLRSFCLERGIDLPAELQLGRIQGWGKSKKDNGRNASWGTNVFPSIDRIKKKEKRESQYARSNTLASWLVVESVRLARERGAHQSNFWLNTPQAMRRVEAALYMIGAKLPEVDPAE